jgi:putative flippase GtrA
MKLNGKHVVRLIKYTMVGATGTLAQFAVLIGLMEVAGFTNATAASTIGATFGALINYALNYRFTFDSRTSHTESLPKFMTTALFGFALNAASMALMTSRWHVQYILAQVVSTIYVFLVTFIINSVWTFKNKKAGD